MISKLSKRSVSLIWLNYQQHIVLYGTGTYTICKLNAYSRHNPHDASLKDLIYIADEAQVGKDAIYVIRLFSPDIVYNYLM